MAFDGVTIAGIVKELNDTILGGRIYKIAQPESDELLLTIKVNGGQQRLFISAGASLPLIYLTGTNKPSPMTAPGFCMLLRKHIQHGRITRISQPGLERIVRIEVEHLNELGDLCTKNLIVEIMGKHSNIIFTDHKDMIIDSIKHISGMVSSVREVLPGRSYFIPETQKKQNPLATEKEQFIQSIRSGSQPLYKVLYGFYTGFSPIFAQELCYRAGLDGDYPSAALSDEDLERLSHVFQSAVADILTGNFTPNIAYEHGSPAEFSVLPFTMYSQKDRQNCPSVSAMLE
ncbi:MAG: NFACT family protein, partial [Kineothrix sp.]|nr:NFACT family protein [Kineothrix sp.]